jgi:hypothetical protein
MDIHEEIVLRLRILQVVLNALANFAAGEKFRGQDTLAGFFEPNDSRNDFMVTNEVFGEISSYTEIYPNPEALNILRNSIAQSRVYLETLDGLRSSDDEGERLAAVELERAGEIAKEQHDGLGEDFDEIAKLYYASRVEEDL